MAIHRAKPKSFKGCNGTILENPLSKAFDVGKQRPINF